MIKLFLTTAACLLSLCTFALPADSLITITSSADYYEFVYNTKDNRVEVKRSVTKNYQSNSYQVTLPFSENYNNQIKIDAIACEVEGRAIRDLKPLDSYYDVNGIFYSDERMSYFPVMLPKKGSTAKITFSETINDPRYLTSAYLNDSYKTDRSEITFKVPRWMQVELKEFNFNSVTVTKTSVFDAASNSDIITYTAQNLPAMVREENSPGRSYIYPHILVLSKTASVGGKSVTYVSSLDDLYKWYKELIKNTPEDEAVISAKAKELTVGLTNDIDKIKAIYYFVQDNIRYVAFEDGIGGFRPERADEVLRRKYGDCKGMANLTRALLKSLGYDARLCWLGTNHLAYNYSTPSVAVDNHMICALFFQGKTMFLDATETYIGFNEYAERIQARQVLIDDGDKYILSQIPLAGTAQNQDNETALLSINNGALSGTVKRVWKGEEKEEILAGINNLKKEKVNEAVIKYLSAGDANSAITDLKLSDINKPDGDLSASYTVNNKTSLSTFGKAFYIDIDNKKEFLNSAIKLSERKTDYWFPYKTTVNRNTEINLPTGYKVSSVPNNLDIVNADYEFHINYAANATKLTYTKKILIKNAALPKSKFEQWNKDIEQLEKAYNETVILKPVTE